MDALVFLLTRVASTEGFIAIIALLIGYLVVKKKPRSVVALLAAVTGLLVSVQGVKELLRIPRPETALIEITGYAFPSGHAAGIAFLALLIMYLCRKLPTFARYAVMGIGIALMAIVGISRVYFGVHTEVQVLGGYLFGAFWALLYISLERSKNRH